MATDDRLHQPARLAAVPESARALDAALAGGAWAAWLSGSGPTVAAFCEPSEADALAAALPRSGHTKVLRIDHEGVCVVGRVRDRQAARRRRRVSSSPAATGNSQEPVQLATVIRLACWSR